MSYSDEKYLKLVRELIAGGHSHHLTIKMRYTETSITAIVSLVLGNFPGRDEILSQHQSIVTFNKQTNDATLGTWRRDGATGFGRWVVTAYALNYDILKEDGLHVYAFWSDSPESVLLFPFPDVYEAQSFEHYQAKVFLKLFGENITKVEKLIHRAEPIDQRHYAVAKHFTYASRGRLASEAARLPIVQAIDLSMKLRRREDV